MNNTIVFVVSCGRSGSASVAKAFGFEHEPDFFEPSIKNVRQRAKGKRLHGECSHFFKSKLAELKKAFPNAVYVHLVRNGLDVVRSFYARWHYRYSVDFPEYPNEPLPVPGFEKMTRLEKLCWYWRYWNEEIEKHIKTRVRIEDLRGLVPIVNRGKKTKDVKFTDADLEVFRKICNNLNTRYGYTIQDSRYYCG